MEIFVTILIATMIVAFVVAVIVLLGIAVAMAWDCLKEDRPYKPKKKKEKKQKHAYRVHYHSSLTKDATIIYAYSEPDAVKRFYKEIDSIHFYDITYVEPLPKWD